MESLYDFISSVGGKVIGSIVAVIIVIIVISFIDRHPRSKDDDDKAKPVKEAPRDDE